MKEEVKGRARGGKARAASMTPEERSAAAKKAAQAKVEIERLPKVTHTGTLRLVDKDIPCAVLDGEVRVLTQSDFMEAMGMYYSGWIANNPANDESMLPAGIPHFLAQKSLIPFINKHLGHLQNIVQKYRTPTGSVAHGIRADIIPAICDVYIDADKEVGLGARQRQIAQKAMLLMRALAHVGIVALVDEATGFQKDRAKDALAKILEAFVAKELQPWVKTFPADYYEQLFRLYGYQFPPEGKPQWRPQFFGRITNDVVYERIAPDLLPELKKAANKAEKKARLHQWLTSDLGHPKLKEHLAAIVTLLKISKSPEQFKQFVDQAFPKFGDTLSFDFIEPK